MASKRERPQIPGFPN